MNDKKQKIIRVLNNNEFSIAEISEKIGLSEATVSKYCHVLEAEGKVRMRRRGNMKLISLKGVKSE